MDRRHFFLWSFVGAVAWVVIITLLGYFLGTMFPAIAKRIELVIILVVFVSILPAIIAFVRLKLGKKDKGASVRGA